MHSAMTPGHIAVRFARVAMLAAAQCSQSAPARDGKDNVAGPYVPTQS